MNKNHQPHYERDPDGGDYGSPSSSLSRDARRPPTPLASFMSEVLHADEFGDVTVVLDGSPTHPSRKCIHESENQHDRYRTLAGKVALDYDCHSYNERSSPLPRSILLQQFPSPPYRRRDIHQISGALHCPAGDHPDRDDGHVIERWKSGIDSSKARSRLLVKPVLRLPSFDHPLSGSMSTPPPPSSSLSPPSLSSFSCGEASGPSLFAVNVPRRDNRRKQRHAAIFPKEKWHRQIPTLALDGGEEGA